jgi:hypothetical protein
MTKSRFGITHRIRGLYKRVAASEGVDPSFVSRVARGERRSPEIEACLNRESVKFLAFVRKQAKPRKKK